MNSFGALRGLLLCALILAAGSATAFDVTGRVVGVVDGDTLDVLSDTKELYRARLAGIDAPERGQPFGAVSKKVLSDLVFSKRVTLRGRKTDRYKRLVAKVIVGGSDANLAMVRLGYAWHYKRYESEQSPADRAEYSYAQEAAKRHRRGLWKDPQPLPPWEYRDLRRNRSLSSSSRRLPAGWGNVPAMFPPKVGLLYFSQHTVSCGGIYVGGSQNS